MFKIVKRKKISGGEKIGIQLASIVLAFVFASIFILMTKNNPLSVYISMFQGAFSNGFRFRETIINAIPLLITALGISLAFKMKFWNIGAEGQIIMGAFGASYFALFHGDLPGMILIPLMFLGGALCGGVWALIPGFFRAYFKTNETIFTLLMNYIALNWITYLQYGPWKDPGAYGFPKIARFPRDAVLPNILGVHMGWLVALALVIWVFYFLSHTKSGYETAVVGESENTAVYAGMNVKKIILRTVLLSGAVCGITGVIQASAVARTLSVTISNGIGYTAIIVAWLSGLNPVIATITSILFSAMVQGGNFIQLSHNIPSAVADILQGTILFFVLGNQFFINYRLEKNR